MPDNPQLDILVVEDDRIIFTAIVAELRQEGFVISGGDGPPISPLRFHILSRGDFRIGFTGGYSSANSLLRTNRPKTLFLDWDLGQGYIKNGIELAFDALNRGDAKIVCIAAQPPGAMIDEILGRFEDKEARAPRISEVEAVRYTGNDYRKMPPRIVRAILELADAASRPEADLPLAAGEPQPT